MGYNISKHSIVRSKPQLDDMLELRRTFEIPTAHPQRLSSKLWEAINSAEKLSERHPEFAKYAELKILYRLRQTKTGVRCEWVAENSVRDSEGDEESLPKPSITAPTRMEVPEAASLVDVVANAMRFGNVPELHFPKAILSEEDRKRLYEWTQSEGVRWAFISHDNAGLTLTTQEVPEEILWRPNGEE